MLQNIGIQAIQVVKFWVCVADLTKSRGYSWILSKTNANVGCLRGLPKFG